MMTGGEPCRVILLAHEHMNLLDLSGPLQALVTANRIAAVGKLGRYETIVASAGGGLVITGSGLPIMTVALSAIDSLPIDTIIVPGGCDGDAFPSHPALVKWIVRRAPEVRRLCSVCTGAFLLAAAGQLDGRRAATHWAWVGRLKKMHPAIQIDPDRIFIRDGAIWTSAGVTAGIDLTLALIEDDFGHRTAINTARELVMFIKRSGGQSQFSVSLAAQAHPSTRFVELHAWMAAHLREDLCIERLAEQTGMSPRTFARMYAEQQSCTPAKAVEAMRIELACRELEATNRPLKNIALAAGFRNEEVLRRAFRRQLGITPVQYRERFSKRELQSTPSPSETLH